MTTHDLQDRKHRGTHWWHVREEHAPIQCQVCKLFSSPADLHFILQPDGKTTILHPACAARIQQEQQL